MKKFLFLAMAALLLGTVTSCNGNSDSNNKTNDSLATTLGEYLGTQLKVQIQQAPADQLDKDQFLKGIETALQADTTKQKMSYYSGLMYGLQRVYPQIAQLEGQGINVDRKLIINEFKKVFESKDSINFNDPALMQKMQTMEANLMRLMEKAQKEKGKENIAEGKKYLEEQMKKDKGFKKTQSGIAYKVIKAGSGDNFNDTITVDVAYVGKHINGKEFDNSHGKPIPFNMQSVVPGFREVIKLMKPGSKVLAIIPGNLAYGEMGDPRGGIGPNETLVFEITTIGVHKEPQMSQMPSIPGQPADVKVQPGQQPKQPAQQPKQPAQQPKQPAQPKK